KKLHAIGVVSAVYNHPRQNRFHPALPAGMAHARRHLLLASSMLSYQHSETLHCQRGIGGRISGDTEHRTLGSPIILTLKRKINAARRNSQTFSSFFCNRIGWSEKLTGSLSDYTGSLRPVGIIDHRSSRFDNARLLPGDDFNGISQIFHVIQT